MDKTLWKKNLQHHKVSRQALGPNKTKKKKEEKTLSIHRHVLRRIITGPILLFMQNKCIPSYAKQMYALLPSIGQNVYNIS